MTNIIQYSAIYVKSNMSSVNVSNWSDEYPIPDGWTVTPSGYYPVDPPATGMDFDLSPATEFIEGQITQDPGDAQPIDYNQTWVQAWPTYGGSGTQSQPDMSGQYSIPVAPDTYDVGAGYNNNGRFLFQPSQYQSLIVQTNDTLRNNDFLANYGHCQVEVTLTGYPSATQNWMRASDDNSWPNGYQTNVEVNNSGTYNLYICNSTGWNVWAPGIAGYDVSPGSYNIGDIFHSDTYQGVLPFIYTPTGVEGKPKDRPLPVVFKLSQNHPNPVRNVASISYQLPKPAKVSMTIYNILGQAVKSFDEGSKEAGYYNIKWDGRDNRNSLLGNGIYFYRLSATLNSNISGSASGGQAGDFVSTKKLVVLR